MFDNDYAPSTIFGYLSSLPAFYRTLGITVSLSRMECPSLALLLRGIRRKTQVASSPKLPFTPEILLKFRSCLDFNSNLHCALWACLMVGFWGFLRSDNLVPKTGSLFDTSHAILRENILFIPQGASIKITRSKTNQFGERDVFVAIPRIKGSSLCPIRALKTLFRCVHTGPASFAFAYSKSKFLTYNSFRKNLLSLCSMVGIDPSSYGTHSCRRGGASFAAACLVDPRTIQLHGDWASSCFLHYIALDPSQKILAMSKMALGIKDSDLVRSFGP